MRVNMSLSVSRRRRSFNPSTCTSIYIVPIVWMFRFVTLVAHVARFALVLMIDWALAAFITP